MHYLIAGGAGFLGSHLAKRLYMYGYGITVVDDLSTGSLDNLSDLIDQENFQFIQHDITKELSIEHKIDGIFNLACPASPIHYQRIPIETNLTCVLGSYNLLKLANAKSCKILQTSTSEVYGDPEVSPQEETYRGVVNCFGPRACYDEGKRAAEALFFDFHRIHQTDIRVVRIFNTYGPNMCVDDGRVVSNFIVQALKKEPITVYGAGWQTRSFCYVDDLIDALLVVWKSNYKKPVNIGNPGEFSIEQLANMVIETVGSTSEIVYVERPEDDPQQRKPEISLAKSLGWGGPKISLDKGLVNTVQYFRSKLES